MKKRTTTLGLGLLVPVAIATAAAGAPKDKAWESFWVASGSMEKTLQLNDRILVNNDAYLESEPKVGDVVTYDPPEEALLNSRTKPSDVVFVMRIVGIPGQSVVMRGGKLFLNGKPATEKFAFWDKGESYDMKIVNGKIYSRDRLNTSKAAVPNLKGHSDFASRWTRNGEFVEDKSQIFISKAPGGKIPANQYLILGDHRSNANDSHCWGFLPRSAIRGKAVSVFWPLSRRKSL